MLCFKKGLYRISKGRHFLLSFTSAKKNGSLRPSRNDDPVRTRSVALTFLCPLATRPDSQVDSKPYSIALDGIQRQFFSRLRWTNRKFRVVRLLVTINGYPNVWTAETGCLTLFDSCWLTSSAVISFSTFSVILYLFRQSDREEILIISLNGR
jgi:hypothetical protein